MLANCKTLFAIPSNCFFSQFRSCIIILIQIHFCFFFQIAISRGFSFPGLLEKSHYIYPSYNVEEVFKRIYVALTFAKKKIMQGLFFKNFVSCSDFFSTRSEMLPGFSMLQSIFTSFFPARSLNFLCFIKNYLRACLQHVKSHGSID